MTVDKGVGNRIKITAVEAIANILKPNLKEFFSGTTTILWINLN